MAWNFYDDQGNLTDSIPGVQVGAGSVDTSSPVTYKPELQESVDYQTVLNEFSIESAKRLWEKQAEADKVAMQFSADEAQKLRDWQTEMSNTAYQRAVSDMRAAGINPILAAANGGASTPGGAAGSGVSSARQAPQLNLENVVSAFKSMVATLDQSAANAKTAAEAQRWSSGVNAVGNILGGLMNFASVPVRFFTSGKVAKK